jgi:hypothetical protein
LTANQCGLRRWAKNRYPSGNLNIPPEAIIDFPVARGLIKARVLLNNPDTAPEMRAKQAEVAAKGYEGFVLQ